MSANDTRPCPACGCENIRGADACVSCGSDLTKFDRPKPESRLAAHIMATRIDALKLDDPLVVEESTTLGEIVNLLADHDKGCVLARDRNGRLAGIFGERDILIHHAHREDDWRSEPVAAYMIPEPVALHGSSTIAVALNKMDIGGYRHIPVVNGQEEPIGVLSVKTVLNHLQTWMEE
jgi:CBS domain-containing protein